MTIRFAWRRRASAALLLLLVAPAACMTSSSPAVVARRDDGKGTVATVLMRSGVQHTGELLAVDDSTVTLLVRERVGTGRLADVATIWIDVDQPTQLVVRDNAWSADRMRRARLWSRFAYGMTPAAWAALLASTAQAAPAPLDAPIP